MTDVGFYHLTRTGPDEALPSLLGRTLASGERALVVCGSAERVAALDRSLWLAVEPDWLPHGTEATGHADLQPIWISTEDAAPNGAGFLFLLDDVASPRLAAFKRVFDLFDGRAEAAVAAARLRWTAARQGGHAVTYWQQGPRGWEKKA